MIHRLWVYQRERFPLLANGALVAVLTAASLLYAALALGAVSGLRLRSLPPRLGWRSVSFSSFASSMNSRITPMIKPFAAIGSLPRGVVSLRELGAIGLLVAGVQVVLTAWISWQLLPLLALVWVYMGLMGASSL